MMGDGDGDRLSVCVLTALPLRPLLVFVCVIAQLLSTAK